MNLIKVPEYLIGIVFTFIILITVGILVWIFGCGWSTCSGRGCWFSASSHQKFLCQRIWSHCPQVCYWPSTSDLHITAVSYQVISGLFMPFFYIVRFMGIRGYEMAWIICSKVIPIYLISFTCLSSLCGNESAWIITL